MPNETSSSILLHIGARLADFPKGWRDDDVSQAILVCPNPKEAVGLEERFQGEDSVRVVAVGLVPGAEEGAKDVFKEANLPELCSFHQPTETLRELFPGFQVTERHEVQLMTPTRFFGELPAEGEINLVLDLPGSEMDVLEGVLAAAVLDRVSSLKLHCTEEVLFEGGVTRETIEAWLGKQGFRIVNRIHSDPDLPVIVLQASETSRSPARMSEIKSKLQAAEAAAERAKKQLADQMETAAQLRDDVERNSLNLKVARRDLALALGRAERLETDLEDMRVRLAAAETRCREYETLLRQLTPRLQEAALALRSLTTSELSGPANPVLTRSGHKKKAKQVHDVQR